MHLLAHYAREWCVESTTFTLFDQPAFGSRPEYFLALHVQFTGKPVDQLSLGVVAAGFNAP